MKHSVFSIYRRTIKFYAGTDHFQTGNINIGRVPVLWYLHEEKEKLSRQHGLILYFASCHLAILMAFQREAHYGRFAVSAFG